ncbi:MAG: 4Fe-4S dicluster domain-containing protein, partial [Myxococcales bacterium]
WVELSPASAARAGAKEGEQVAVTTSHGEANLTLRINPGLHDEAVAIPASAPELRVVGAGVAAKVRKSGPVSALVAAIAPMSRGQEGRDLARAVSAAAPTLPPPPKHREMIAEPEHPEHRWGMSIDLDRCTGCQACVVACYAENNIPVNGPVFANAGRSMAWLRIQRTYEKNADGSLKLRVLPSLCQQCDAAPCEPVCPVYATYHTQEGLNAQVYNRCIGTRYCANNCPYDARVFNWKSPVFEGTLAMQLNPDVSVRDKGMMEKCTFCVQRIRIASFAAEQEGRRLYDGDITPACAQTCPTQAIVFGDLRDPNSRASVLSTGPRGYNLLDDLNTRPAITYLARIEDET